MKPVRRIPELGDIVTSPASSTIEIVELLPPSLIGLEGYLHRWDIQARTDRDRVSYRGRKIRRNTCENGQGDGANDKMSVGNVQRAGTEVAPRDPSMLTRACDPYDL